MKCLTTLPLCLPRIPTSGHRLRRAGWLLLALCASSGSLRAEVPILGKLFPGKSSKQDKQAELLVEVQQSLLRFADEYSLRMAGGIDVLQRGGKPLSPAEVLRLKIALTTETLSIASGSNALADLLDLTIFVTVTRMTLEDHWQPRVFGKSGLPALEFSRTAEAAIWKLAGKVLTPEQEVELRAAILAWHRGHPLRESLVAARSLGFASRLAEERKVGGGSGLGGVFGLLVLDPFAGMKPAVREVAETRLFAERALFVTQKLPTLVRWQTELLTINAASLPEVQQLVANSTLLASAVDRFTRAAEQLPDRISREREEILRSLESKEKELTPLVSEMRQTLAEGTEMSTSLNTTFTTFDALMKRFGVGEPKIVGPPGAKGEPFRVLDYARTAAQLEVTAGRLTELLVTFDRVMDSPNLQQLPDKFVPVVQQAQTGSREIVDYAFWKAMMLVGCVFAAALLYRILAARLPSPGKGGTSPDNNK